MTKTLTKTTGTARIVVPCASAQQAEDLRRALEPDNEGYLSSSVQGSELVLEVPSSGLGRLVQTVDDALACLTVALGATGEPEAVE